MKFIRFKIQSNPEKIGILEDSTITEITGNIFESYEITDKKYQISEIAILPPVYPSKIVAVGLNYKDHAIEMNRDLPKEPRIFLKPSTSVIAHGENIVYPKHMSSRVDYEGELGVVIGKKARKVEKEKAFDYVLGYTCINDITARDLQSADIQFTRAKGFDTFAPIGPVIESEIEPSNLEISTYLNGIRKQHSYTSKLIFKIEELISFISNVMTLLPGDIISTGTPSGVAPMEVGDTVEVEIKGVGKLTNNIV